MRRQCIANVLSLKIMKIQADSLFWIVGVRLQNSDSMQLSPQNEYEYWPIIPHYLTIMSSLN